MNPAGRRFTVAARLSLAGSLIALFSVVTAFTVGRFTHFHAWMAVVMAFMISLLFALLATRSVSRRITSSLGALLDGVRGFRDKDFSLRLARHGSDEISDLVRVYNEMGDVLRAQRADTVQKELLLDTILEGSPTAIVLTNAGDRVVYSNRAARELFGRRLEGVSFGSATAELPVTMRDAIASGRDVLFTLPAADREETFHVSRRRFALNTQAHTLVMIERLTPELRRQEVAVWKKAIRTMSHELNNSLAPISSLVHSMQHAAGRPEHAHRLEEIYTIIEERLQHLSTFLRDYADFARLPSPRRARFEWSALLDEVQRLYPFRLDAPAHGVANLDRAQIQQMLINLLKNAHESGSAAEEVAIEIAQIDTGTQLRVLDRGRGMNAETMRQAILPFYSTKPEGTGLGLAICSEIVDGHGGRLAFNARDGGGTTVTVWLPQE